LPAGCPPGYDIDVRVSGLAITAITILGTLACDRAPPTILGTTLLHDTTDAAGPYIVTTVVRAQAALMREELRFRLDDGDEAAVTMTRLGEDLGGASFAGAIPGPGGLAHVQYRVVVDGADGLEAVDPPGDARYAFDVMALARACAGAADCAAGEICVAARCQAAPASCVDDTGCPAGSRCQSGVCARTALPCQQDGDCPTTELCDPELRVCTPRP
jgi:hypothetical protein